MKIIGLKTIFVTSCVALVGLLGGTSAEVRLLCPRPQTANSSNTQGPCDPQGLSAGALEMTDVSPGPLTVRWEETVYRTGAPSRIALKSRSESTTCVLLDHIPHNDNQFTDKGNECNPDGYPIGRCRRSMTAVTVLIPDIQCDDCYLQLISVDTSNLAPGQPPCSLDDPVETSNCTVYYSCADIKIWATDPGRASSLQCEAYPSNLDGPWPYQLRATLRVNSDFANLFFFKASFELRGNSFTYDVQLRNVDRADIVPNTEGLYDVATALVARTFSPISENELVYQGSFEITQAFLIDRLLSGRLGIGLRSVTNGLIIFPLQANSTMFVPNTYSPLSAEYSTRGLLRVVDPAFSQADVLYSTPFKQAGPCAFDSRTMTAALMVQGSQVPAGLVRASTVEYYLYITAVIIPPNFDKINVSLALDFSNSVTATDPLRVSEKLVMSDMPRFVVDGVEDMENFLLRTLGDLPDTVRVATTTVDETSSLMGTLVGGLWAEVRDEQGELTGMATVSLLNGTGLSTKLLLLNFTTAPQLGGLFGPALPGRLGAQVILPTTNARLTDLGNSNWMVQADLEINSAQIVRYMWEGLHYIDIRRNGQTPARSVSGQLSKLDRWACQNVNNAACLVSELSAPVPVGDRSLPTTAFVAFFPLDSVRVELSIVVRNLQIGETVTRVEIRNDSSGDVTDITPPFKPSPVENGAVEGEGIFLLPGNDPAALKSASMRTVVYTSRFPNGEITGDMGVQEQPGRNATPEVDQVTADDFSLDCGQRDTGPMRIVLNKPGLDAAGVYAEDFFSTCSFVNTGSTWTLANARGGNSCGVQVLSGATWVAYEVMVVVQRQPLIETAADPRFSLSCNFSGAATEVRVVAGSLTVLKKPFQRKQETIRGDINQVYSLSIVNNTDRVTPVNTAMLGDRVALAVTMLGTDPDEQSLRVRRCVATNTKQTEVVLLDNYCPVLQSMIDGDSGFVTSGTRSVLPGIQAFRIQDSPDGIVIFSCIVEPCNNAQACNGNNCGGQTIRRKRQSSEDNSPLLRLVVQYRVFDPQESQAAQSADNSRQASSIADSTQVALLVTVAVVSALLIVSVIGTIFTFYQMRKIKGDKSADIRSS